MLDHRAVCGTSPVDGPPAPAEIFLEMGVAIAVALGLAVVIELMV